MSYDEPRDDRCARCERPHPTDWINGRNPTPEEEEQAATWAYFARGPVCPDCLDADDIPDLEAQLARALGAYDVAKRNGLLSRDRSFREDVEDTRQVLRALVERERPGPMPLR